MIEIALSLAVVAFALVAIMGVLPTGMTVQRDNREDIIINQEGKFWLDAIRTGARGLEDLTNYVEAITITNRGTGTTRVFSEVNGPNRLMSASDIIGLLCVPHVLSDFTTNDVRLRVKAITGLAAEKGPLTNEFSFRYQVQSQISRSLTANANLGQRATNLFDVRLVLRWPVVQRGNDWYVGDSRKTFRALVAGRFDPVTNLSTFIQWNGRFQTNAQIIVPNNFNG
jgi:hypothetical protein